MDQQNEPKIIRINILQTSMTLGTYLGAYIILAYLVTLLTVKYPALSLLAVPLFIGIPVVAFFLIRRFRDSTQVPFFPFPISWMLSILTFLFATVLSCMVAYLYLRFLDNGALAAGLTAFAVLCGCSSTQQFPMDDAYYRPEKTVAPSKPSAPQTTSNDVKQPQTNFEYISVQDTTVTIRIKK